MSLYFLRAGLQTSVQDAGRFGQMHNGVSLSGAMDAIAMQSANWLVGKPAAAPVLEITLTGPRIAFEQAMYIALCGASFTLRLNQQKIAMHHTIQVKAGDILDIGELRQGCRAYLACSLDVELPQVLGSASTHLGAGFGGYHGRALQNGDRLVCGQPQSCSVPVTRQLPAELQRGFSGNYLLRCTQGLEFEAFSPALRQAFLNQQWQVHPQSNRMGIRLSGQPLAAQQQAEMRSSGVLPGTVQIPGGGQPIITAMDGQTIGGYPRLAHVIQADMPLLGQLKGGDKVSFALITAAQARALKRQQDQLMAQR